MMMKNPFQAQTAQFDYQNQNNLNIVTGVPLNESIDTNIPIRNSDNHSRVSGT